MDAKVVLQWRDGISMFRGNSDYVLKLHSPLKDRSRCTPRCTRGGTVAGTVGGTVGGTVTPIYLKGGECMSRENLHRSWWTFSWTTPRSLRMAITSEGCTIRNPSCPLPSPLPPSYTNVSIFFLFSGHYQTFPQESSVSRKNFKDLKIRVLEERLDHCTIARRLNQSLWDWCPKINIKEDKCPF